MHSCNQIKHSFHKCALRLRTGVHYLSFLCKYKEDENVELL